MDETSTEIHAINPSDLPLTRDTRMERESFGFPSGSTPRHYWQRMLRRGQVLWTLTQGYIFDISRTSYNESTHNLRPRVAPPSMPRGRRCPRGRGKCPQPRACRFTAARPLHPGNATHRPKPPITRRHQGFTHVHPSGLLLTCAPRMERGTLGLKP